MEARGLTLTETARRVPCSKGYLSNLLLGLRGASEQMAGRLDGVLEASGELAVLAETAEATTREDKPAATGGRPGPADGPQTAVSGGMSLTLPYVPARLVIEVSGPAGNPGLLAGTADGTEVSPGRLALVRDSLPGAARKEATIR